MDGATGLTRYLENWHGWVGSHAGEDQGLDQGDALHNGTGLLVPIAARYVFAMIYVFIAQPSPL